MKMNNKMTWDKLAQYFAGEFNGEGKKKMENWIKANPEREEKVEQLYKIWRESEIPPFQLNVEEAWNRLSAEMDAFEQERRGLRSATAKSNSGNFRNYHRLHKKGRKTLGTTRRIMVAAATVLILVSAGLFSFYISSVNDADAITENDHRVFITQHGERASYVLNDGSNVILHAGSRLEIPENYNIENRELYLEGEAYFETVHDTEHPFIVHSRHSYTKVVGTRFLVQSWNEAGHEVEVIVSEGKVLFGDSRSLEAGDTKEVLVSQNHRGTLSGDAGPVVSKIEDLDWHLGWTEGRLVFENRPLSEVIPKLERWYHLEINIENKEIADKRITAEIDYSLPMSEVLEGVAMAFELEVEREGRTITFR